MSKKDYILLASALREEKNRTKEIFLTASEVVENITEAIAEKMKEDNAKFDKVKFINAINK